MSPLDAAFLEAEDGDPSVSMAISSIAVFEGPPPTVEEFSTAIARRLPLIPRYRQKVRRVPLDLCPPAWVDDPDFDLAYHLRRTALPSPGSDDELATLMGRIMSARLDRRRPLWEYWLVEGLAEDRWALISKVHHCMVDGVSGTDLYRIVLDPTPAPSFPLPDEWHPAREPSAVSLAAGAALVLARLPLDQARALAGAARSPALLARRAAGALRGLAALGGALAPTTESSLSGPLSAERRFAFARGRVADVSTIRHALGGTFNDVVLAAITAGFRDLLLSRGELPTASTVRTLVPVSTRTPGEESIRDNRVSLMLARLPVDVADPRERLVAVREELSRLKDRHEAEAGAAMLAMAGYEPFPVLATPMRLAWRLSARLPQRSVVTVTTNVPGPRVPLYALSRRLVEIIPYVPIASRLRVGVSIFSYVDAVTFGVTGDYDGAADVAVMARGIAAGLDELLAAARPESADTPVHSSAPRRRRRATAGTG